MEFREITSDIFYCGVNDRVTEKFEGLWPLRRGVSYNSYLVCGDHATALIDTVRIDDVREFLSQVKSLGRSIDYLVINHMEPDHSGSIPEVLKTWPDIKIVGNANTIRMVRGYHHIDDPERYVEIKEGSEIDLGGRTLRFYMTPMVHWPETMMTYVPERKTLFSGDGFGAFGALNGGIVDTEMDIDWYWDEMRRYYSNIVGKYGKFVQMALKKLSGVALDYICPTHGPVWHEYIEKTVSIYDRMSRYESEPGVTVIYGSMYGNTAEMAELIARELSAAGVRTIRVHNASHSDLSDMIADAFRYKGLIVGSATYSMTLFPPVKAFMDAMETREIRDKVFATFGGYTWAKGVSVGALGQYAERMGITPVGTAMMDKSLDDDSAAQAGALAKAVAGAL